ncbi:MAG: hypothetical protein RL522_1886 [Pseudomonadota bacterium]|jgi:hypothetical protein
MRRRIFLQGGSSTVVLALTGCGGGGGGAPLAGTGDTVPLAASANAPLAAVTSPAAQEAAPAAGGSGYLFGSRKDLVGGRYPYGIMPTGVTAAAMDARIKTCYEAWKGANLRKSPTFTANTGIYAGRTISDAYHVQFPGTTYATVSEGVGYGMLIMVLMAGHDAQARTYFDGMFKTARGRPAYGHMNAGKPAGAYLHEWRLAMNMGSAGEGWNATDGDLDIAQALLMAHRQWGSTGAIDYRQEALNTIGALKTINFATSGEPRGPQRENTRTSDHMIGHFRAFKKATGDAFWDKAIDRCHTLITGIIARYSPNAKLQPGFIVDCLSQPAPSPGYLIEGPYEGIYDGNAVRNPWRWGTDYIYSGDTRWKTIVSDMANFLKNDCNGDPFTMGGLYNLNGTVNGGRYFAEIVVGPLTVGCMVDASHQAFLNTLWTANANNFTTDYYDSELQLIPLIVASGNWWNP